MPDDENSDSDKTPVEPLMERKKSSQTAMKAIGWRTCPDCEGIEGVHCETCFDPATRTYARSLPPDEYIKWIQQRKKAIELHDTEPEMAAVHPDTERMPKK